MPPLHAWYLCARCSYNAERRTAPHPPPMAVPLPRRGRFCVTPFIHTGYIRYVPRNGTQAVPYGFADWFILEPRYLQSGHVRCSIIVNCSLSIVNFFAVPCGFADGWIFEPTDFKSGHVRCSIIDNCPLSIVNYSPRRNPVSSRTTSPAATMPAAATAKGVEPGVARRGEPVVGSGSSRGGRGSSWE